jgi:uridine kinase
MAPRPLLVGLGGGSCAGKTTLAELIHDSLKPAAAIIASDRYYRSLDHLPPEKRPRENFDSPGMLDRALLEEHLELLRAGKPAELPVYDFCLHTRSKETERLIPPPVIIVEGIFLLADPGLRKLFDLSVYVETREDIRFARRLRRDRKERGRTAEEVRERYFAEVRPAHQKLVRPGRAAADLVVRGEENLKEAARIVVDRIVKLPAARTGEDGRTTGGAL